MLCPIQYSQLELSCPAPLGSGRSGCWRRNPVGDHSNWRTTETDTCGTIPINPDDIMRSSAVGGMRVTIRYVGAAWRRFCRDKREATIRSSCCIDASLTIDGSSDSEISNKGLPTPHLMPALKDRKTRGVPTAVEGAMSTSDWKCFLLIRCGAPEWIRRGWRWTMRWQRCIRGELG